MLDVTWEVLDQDPLPKIPGDNGVKCFGVKCLKEAYGDLLARVGRRAAALTLQPRVNRFAFESEYRKGAFVHPVQRFPLHKALEALYSQGKFPKRE